MHIMPLMFTMWCCWWQCRSARIGKKHCDDVTHKHDVADDSVHSAADAATVDVAALMPAMALVASEGDT